MGRRFKVIAAGWIRADIHGRKFDGSDSRAGDIAIWLRASMRDAQIPAQRVFVSPEGFVEVCRQAEGSLGETVPRASENMASSSSRGRGTEVC